MMKAHVIKNDVVVNTIVVDSLDFMPGLVEATTGGIGWDYLNGKFIDNRPIPLEIVPTPELAKEQLLAELRVLTAKIEALA
jgi:hypothetical protein